MECRRATAGFTLVELLVTMTIVAIMAGVVFGAMQAVRNAAREARTRATIAKIKQYMMARYDTYRTRRVPDQAIAFTNQAQARTEKRGAYRGARARLNAIRDLMRMEMPDRWSDCLEHSSGGSPKFIKPLVDTRSDAPCPAVTEQFFRAYSAMWQVSKRDSEAYQLFQDNGAAECLHLIVMSDPEAAGQFTADEQADTDGDGLMEFVDGWGRAIRYLRWPAGFIAKYNADSDLQTDEMDYSVKPPILKAPDPFDPLVVDAGYALYPLIYSAGADGKYDINIGKSQSGSGGSDSATMAYKLNGQKELDPYAPDPGGYLVGQPVNQDDPGSTKLRHYDNIHSHHLEIR